ncbi:cytochrome P450 [Cladorrhinum sp. PSN332]|nr:cytochrome P450 [Cladorrhinum sp. PSN332]
MAASIASNITSFLPSREELLRDGILTAASKNIPLTIGIATLLTLLLNTLLTPRVDPREPPLLKPSIPLIGHIVDLFRYQAKFHTVLSRKNRDQYPIATLQMLTGKMYAIWDPTLIASGFKNKHLSTNPIIHKYINNLMAPTPEGLKLLTSPEGDEMADKMLKHIIPQSMRGIHLENMTNVALGQLSVKFNQLSCTPEQIPNFYLWARHVLCYATSTTLYGDASQDPFRLNPEMEQAVFDFESSLMQLSLGLPFPAVTAAKGHRARQTLRKGLEPFYSQKLYDKPEVCEFVRSRAHTLHKDNIPEVDIPRVEIMLPFAAMANTAPTLFWFLVFVLSSPKERQDRLRREVLDALVLASPETAGEEQVEVCMKINQALVEEKCPLLWASYRETMRVTVHQVASRQVTHDTVLQSSQGQEFLLKAGTQVQMAPGNMHKMSGWWGEDADQFRPERWLEPQNLRSTRVAYAPFGGGIHLCPGRMFAFTEMAAVVAIFLLGFEVEPNAFGRKEWKLPGYRLGSLVDAVSKPADDGEGFGMNVKPRKGWENVKWKLEYA